MSWTLSCVYDMSLITSVGLLRMLSWYMATCYNVCHLFYLSVKDFPHLSFSLMSVMLSQISTIPPSECSSCQLVQQTPCGTNDGWCVGHEPHCSVSLNVHSSNSKVLLWGKIESVTLTEGYAHVIVPQAVLCNPVCNCWKHWLLHNGQIKMDV
jgi:hypothetical protein